MWQALKENRHFKSFVSFLSLFGSFGTLLCCALPSALVLLGFGATFASFLGSFPQLIWLSEKKLWVFGFSFFMLTISYLARRFAQTQICPIDKKDDCENTKSWSGVVFWAAFSLNMIGAFFAFLLPPILDLLD